MNIMFLVNLLKYLYNNLYYVSNMNYEFTIQKKDIQDFNSIIRMIENKYEITYNPKINRVVIEDLNKEKYYINSDNFADIHQLIGENAKVYFQSNDKACKEVFPSNLKENELNLSESIDFRINSSLSNLSLTNSVYLNDTNIINEENNQKVNNL